MYTTKISYYFDGAGHRRRRSDLEIGAAFSRKQGLIFQGATCPEATNTGHEYLASNHSRSFL